MVICKPDRLCLEEFSVAEDWHKLGIKNHNLYILLLQKLKQKHCMSGQKLTLISNCIQKFDTSKRDQTETQPQYGAKFLWLCCVQEVGWETSVCHLVSSSEVSVLISDFSFWQRY